MRRVAVIVLGDLGHSPRMQYHCLSLARDGYEVDFIGYRGSSPHESLLNSPRVKLRYLAESPSLPSVFGLALKLVWQFFTLFHCLLFTIRRPDVILLQNPPGLPAMLVCWLVAKLLSTHFLIDWHNYTHTILAMRYGSDSYFVKFVKFYEFFLGRKARGGFCVTNRMRDDLAGRGIAVRTHYDRPSANFRPLDDRERLEFLIDLSEALLEFRCLLPEAYQTTPSDERPTAMLISSTSWTPDENFDVLLAALKTYDGMVSDSLNLPELLVVITGKGPLKDYYVKKAQDYAFRHVTLVTPWLRAEDYPKMLACADAGLSLHFSSSGLDLPMKVVDMQGCALPVLGARFACAGESVRDGENGFLFADAAQLAGRLRLLLADFPAACDTLHRLRAQCRADRARLGDWDAAWGAAVGPYLTELLAPAPRPSHRDESPSD